MKFIEVEKMKAGTHRKKYEYIPPEKRVGKKEQQRIMRSELRKAMRKASPLYACVEDNCKVYLDDEV